MAKDRDHLFINYATEDGAFAEWLALRLTAEGYKVWIDRFKLLGGESYPKDIDAAIKTRTFRFLTLLSRHSLHKPNPLKERTLALNLQQDLEQEFVIPINVDGLEAIELNWMTSDITFIPVWSSWAAGLDQLLKKLEKVDAPKSDTDGPAIAASVFLPKDVLLEKPEVLYSNLLAFERIPVVVHCHRSPRKLTAAERNQLADDWAYWALPDRSGPEFYFSFTAPPQNAIMGASSWKRVESAAWRDVKCLRQDLNPEHVVKPLLRRSVLYELRQRGLRPTQDPTVLYFPSGLLPGNWINFLAPDGDSKRRSVLGEQQFPNGGRFKYHLAVTFDVLRDLKPDFIAKTRIRVYITDLDGQEFDAVSANARRKQVTRDWWNDEWLNRHLAICSFMAAGKERIRIGNSDPVILFARPLELEAPRGIDESAIPKGIPRYSPADEPDEEAESRKG